MKYVKALTREEIETLQQCSSNHKKRLVRLRAHAVLLSDRGYCLTEISTIDNVERKAVSRWIDRWQESGIAGLYDSQRPGRPPLLNADEQKQVISWVNQSPRNLKKVGALIENETDKQVSMSTIKRITKKNG